MNMTNYLSIKDTFDEKYRKAMERFEENGWNGYPGL